MKPAYRMLPLLGLAVLLAACGQDEATENGERTLAVTAAEVGTGDVEVQRYSVGRIESTVAPRISAEVAGQVVELLQDAGDTVRQGDLLARIDDSDYQNARERAEAALERAEALLDQHRRTVERYRALVTEESAAQSLLDEAEAQLASTQAQRREARAQLDDARKALQRTRVTAPVDGVIQSRQVSAGDYVGIGEPLFMLASAERLRVVLPFPERLQDELATGQDVLLSRPSGAGEIRAAITDLRPMVGAGSRAVEAIVELDNPGGWRPGGSVSARVITESRRGQPLVPAQAVVQRPAGHVVYLIDGDRARARQVEVGVRLDGMVEILAGVEPGQRIAVDGAGFLADGTRVEIRD